jgi:hypothetical protein
MELTDPFLITLYDRDFQRQGWLGDPESLSVSVNHNKGGDATITVGARNAKLPLLMERGARVTIDYWGEPLISGAVRARAGKGPGTEGTLTFTVVDDFRLLSRVLGWPVPTAALDAQTAEHYVVEGPAETVVKDVVQVNAIDRLGEPVSIAPDLGRGADICCAFRFHPLADVLLPAADTAGIGVTVRQSGPGLLLDCYEPELHPRTLTEEGGAVISWSWAQAEDTATNVVVGGGGEGTARVFAQFTEEVRVGLLNERIEVFRDARDTSDPAVMEQRAHETLVEGSRKTGLSVTLAETGVFRYGGPGGLHIGDRVELVVGDALAITDTLRTVTLAWTREAGLVITPAIGDITDNLDRAFADALATVAAGVRDLRRH